MVTAVLTNLNGEVLWTWRKKSYKSKVAAQLITSGDYYSLGNSGNVEVLAWRAPRQLEDGIEHCPEGSSPVDQHTDEKLTKAYYRRHPYLA
jgi:hypothetical protein